jgi:1-deoxy-D-xylulose-5-phosphate synthase
MFESMGITYLGPVNGHDIEKLIRVFKVAKRIDHAVLVHVVTQKGHGYKPAERNPSKFHGIAPFDIKTGDVLAASNGRTYSEVFSDAICKLAKNNTSLAAITAAMPDGTGLAKFSKWYPDRFFDVGIAEAHAVTFSAGLAAGGMTPVFAVYSSFLQRAYDQILHDVCIQQLHVVFAVDRAGLVGSDGETHQGIFDLSFLSSIPNMTVFVPKNDWELEEGLKFATEIHDGPIALRYPRGAAYTGLSEFKQPIVYGESEMIYEEKDIMLFAVGNMVAVAETVRKNLKKKGLNVSLVNARFVKPIDEAAVFKAARTHSLIVTMEENVMSGGFGEHVCQLVSELQLPVKVLNISLPDDYVEHGSVDILKAEEGIDADTVTERVASFYESSL